MTTFPILQYTFRILAIFFCTISVIHAEEDGVPAVSERTAPDFVARILPLGASIVWGYNTTEGNGFRKPLRDALITNGWNVDMVGSKQHGTMINNNVEAHPGDVVTQIHKASFNSVTYQPNIIVMNAGTNDCFQHIDIANTGERLSAMLDDLFKEIPGVTIVVSTLVLSTNKEVVKDRGTVNDQYRALVSSRRVKKDKVVLAEMDGDGDAFVRPQDLNVDGVHPNEAGHLKMSRIFYAAIQQAYAEGLLTKSNESDSVSGKGQEVKSSIVASPSTSTSIIIPPTTSSISSITTTSTTSSSSSTTTTNIETPTSTSTQPSVFNTQNVGNVFYTAESSTATASTTVKAPVTSNDVVASMTRSVETLTTRTTAASAASPTSPTTSAGLQTSGAISSSMRDGSVLWRLAPLGLAAALNVVM